MFSEAMTPIITRAQAKAQGLKRYFTGKPCKRGHVAEARIGGGCVECISINNARWSKANPRLRRVLVIASQARKNGTLCDEAFLLSETRLPCPAICPILGTPISFKLGSGHRPAENTASFDQISPRAGYVPGNVRIISQLANAMLQNATPEQRLSLANWIILSQPKETRI